MIWLASTSEDHVTAVRTVIEELTGGTLSTVAVTPETHLAELGISSLMLFRFVTRLEEVSGVAIPDEEFDVRNFRTVASTCSAFDRAAV